jgi:uncharacterized protein YggE
MDLYTFNEGRVFLMRTVVARSVALLLLLLANPAHAQEPSPSVSEGTMSIAGQGEHEVTPEVLTFFASISHNGDTAAEARTLHLAVMQVIRAGIDELVPQGLFVVRSTYGLRSDQPFRYAPDESLTMTEREKAVYFASTSFVFSIENLPAASTIVSRLAMTDLELSGFKFTVRDERAALLEARKAAARDALDQAGAYADALSLELVGIQSVTDGDAQPVEGYADPVVDTSVPVDLVIPETISYRGSVQIVWMVRPL